MIAGSRGALAAGLAALLLAAGAGAGERADRITEIRAAIAQDRARLADLLSDSSRGDPARLHEDPELAEIAGRLPALQRELAERLAADAPATAPAPPPATDLAADAPAIVPAPPAPE